MSFLSKCFLHKLIIDEQTEAQKVHRICSSNSNSSGGWGGMLGSRSRCPSVTEKNNHIRTESVHTRIVYGGGGFRMELGANVPPNITVAGRASSPPQKKVESLIGEGIPTNDGGKGGPASHRSLHYMG